MKELVKKHSEFIGFPIKLSVEKEIKRKVIGERVSDQGSKNTEDEMLLLQVNVHRCL